MWEKPRAHHKAIHSRRTRKFDAHGGVVLPPLRLGAILACLITRATAATISIVTRTNA